VWITLLQIESVAPSCGDLCELHRCKSRLVIKICGFIVLNLAQNVYIKKHNTCWPWWRGSGGYPKRPRPSSSHTQHSLVSRRSGWDRHSNLWTCEAAPVSHRSLAETCAGTCIWLVTWLPNKAVKTLTVSVVWFSTRWAVVWTHISIPASPPENVRLTSRSTVAFILNTDVWDSLLDLWATI